MARRVLLLTTPYRSVRYRAVVRKIPPTLPFLGVAYIAAMLEREQVPVRVVDAWGKQLSFEHIKSEIAAFCPDMIGITSTAPAFGIAIELAQKIKEVFPHVCVVFGGPYVSAIPEETLRELPWVDMVVVGEGEYTMVELAQGRPWQSIKGLVYRQGSRIVANPPRPLIEDLDALPFPDRSFYRTNCYLRPFYEFHGAPVAAVVTSRGCPFQCTFCASHTVAGRRIRLRSIPNIVEEIDQLLARYRVRFVSIADDAPVFTMDQERLETFCRMIRGRPFLWGAKARADSINEKNLSLMHAAGCRVLEIGCESGNPDILEGWEKGVTVSQIKEAFHLMRRFGISSVAMFMLGAPKETPQSIQRTIRFAKALGATYVIARILYPYPGTQAYEALVQKGMVVPRRWDMLRDPRSGDPVLRHPNLSTSDLALPGVSFAQLLRWQRIFHRSFYLRWRYGVGVLAQIRNWQAVKAYLRLAAGVMRFWVRWGLQ